MKQRVLVTGAAGRIGSFIIAHLVDRYDFVLSDVRRPANTHGFPFIKADISDFEAMRNLCQGINTVVHLAATVGKNAPRESLLPNNIIGVYNLFEAAHQAGCRRVVFASSVNVVDGYPAEVQIHTCMPIRPPNLYGASKVWGEAVACFYAYQKNLSAICLRLGWVVDRNEPTLRIDHPLIDRAITYRDLTELLAASIDAPADLQFGIFHGVSNNRWKRLDISDTRAVLGYGPKDDSFVLAKLNERS
jgi:nucleoside-diphosphate-sugar epimerase